MGNKGMLEQGAGNYYNYDFLQAHFHWGSHSGQGSEHRIDDVEYPLELHIVHTNTKHGADTDAAVDPEECYQNGSYCGLAVVGILFHIGSENNTVMDPFVEAAYEIGAKATYAEQNAVKVAKWIVMENTISISEYQIEAFRTLKYVDGAPMVDNYRHPQPVNNRVVKRVLRDLKQDATA